MYALDLAQSMSHMGVSAPMNAPSEQTLSIRVACEGADCNALLEVNSSRQVETFE